MFGDSLLPSECSLIIAELKQTALCFQVSVLSTSSPPHRQYVFLRECALMHTYVSVRENEFVSCLCWITKLEWIVQCAHGRPTTVPLVNLEALHKQIAKIALMNDDLNGLWHGLCRHELAIERAAQRLSLATSWSLCNKTSFLGSTFQVRDAPTTG